MDTADICQVLDIALGRHCREGRTPRCIWLGWQEYGRLRTVTLAHSVYPTQPDDQIDNYRGYRVSIAGEASLVKVV